MCVLTAMKCPHVAFFLSGTRVRAAGWGARRVVEGSFFPLFFSLWGASRQIVGAVQGRIPPKVRVWASLGSSCASPNGLQAALVSHDSPRVQTCTFTGPRIEKHHQWGGRGKHRARIFGLFGRGEVRERGDSLEGGRVQRPTKIWTTAETDTDTDLKQNVRASMWCETTGPL